MTCIECQNLNIGINITERHKHCNRCGCPNMWDFKLENPLPNSDKNGWWKEIMSGEKHWNRCDDFKKKCAEIRQTEKDTIPVGTTQRVLPPQNQQIIQTPASVGVNKPDSEIMDIIQKCGELESVIYQVSQEIAKKRPDGIDNIANRITQIYNTRKINERLDKLISLWGQK